MTRQLSDSFLVRMITLILSIHVAVVAVAYDRLLVIGDATWGGWSLDRSAVMIRDTKDPDVFRYTGWLNADKEFKFLTEAHWDCPEYRNASSSPYILGDGKLILRTGGAEDNKFKVARSANYTIECNLKMQTISVTEHAYQDAPILHNALFVVGSATKGGWLLPAAEWLNQNSNDPFLFEGDMTLSPGIFKIATNCYADYREQKFFYRSALSEDMISEDSSGDRQWDITKAGLYHISVDLTTSEIDVEKRERQASMGSVLDWSRTDSALTLNTSNGSVVLTPYNDNIIKVFTLPCGSEDMERGSISVCAVPNANFNVYDSEDAVIMSTSHLTARVSKHDGHITFTDSDGNVLLEESIGLDNSLMPRMVSFRAMGDDAFYGGGYNGKHTNLDNVTLTMNNTQTGGWDNTWDAPHNICIPFVVSSSGYGILFDDHYRGARIVPSSSVGTTYTSESDNPIAYYFIGGSHEDAKSDFASVMDNYTILTGRQQLPPYWALGYMTSRYGYHSQAEAEDVVSRIKAANLPLDALIFDLYWQGEDNSGMGNLDWYKPKFPDAKKMMSDFADQKVKTVCITEPFFTSVSSHYDELRDLGYLADDDVSGMEWLGAPKAGLLDASNPKALDWMWKYYKMRTEEGVGGWWLDLGEPERHDDDSRHLGGNVSQVHNEFGNLWIERVYRGYCEDFPDTRPFLMPRGGTAGMQRFSAFPWTGDIRRSYAGLAAQIPALINAGMSALGYMGNDVSGFATDGIGVNADLYLRWIELATFSPMMRTHSTLNPEPYLDCYASVVDDVRRFLNLRYRYLPYTYTLAWDNATTGSPLARPLCYHDVSWCTASPVGLTDEYLWGRDILVAPVIEDGATSRYITFPQGRWVDLNNLSKVYVGGQTVSYDAPLNTLPYFGRMQSFIPMYAQQEYENTADIDRSCIDVTYLVDIYHQGKVKSYMYDDDHVSTRTLESEAYAITTFEGENVTGGHRVSVRTTGNFDGMPSTTHYKFCVPGYHPGDITGICINGKDVPMAVSQSEFDSATVAYILDANHLLTVKFDKPADTDIDMLLSHVEGLGVSDLYAPRSAMSYDSIEDVIHVCRPGCLRIVDISGKVYMRETVDVQDVLLTGLSAGVYVAMLDGEMLKIIK